jgi:hypothetical protein
MFLKPDYEAQIMHGRREVNNALKFNEESVKTEENLIQKVENYKKELALVKRAADNAQGAPVDQHLSPTYDGLL